MVWWAVDWPSVIFLMDGRQLIWDCSHTQQVLFHLKNGRRKRRADPSEAEEGQDQPLTSLFPSVSVMRKTEPPLFSFYNSVLSFSLASPHNQIKKMWKFGPHHQNGNWLKLKEWWAAVLHQVVSSIFHTGGPHMNIDGYKRWWFGSCNQNLLRGIPHLTDRCDQLIHALADMREREREREILEGLWLSHRERRHAKSMRWDTHGTWFWSGSILFSMLYEGLNPLQLVDLVLKLLAMLIHGATHWWSGSPIMLATCNMKYRCGMRIWILWGKSTENSLCATFYNQAVGPAQ